MNCARLAAMAIVVHALAACGGGSSGSGSGFVEPATGAPADATRVTAEGLWTGTTLDGRGATLVILEDGSFWVLYSAAPQGGIVFPGGILIPAPPGTPQFSGFMQGSGVSAPVAGTYDASGMDYNFDGFGINPIMVDADYAPRDTISGTIVYPSLGFILGFNLVHDDAYELAASLSSAAGTYSGIGRPADPDTGPLEPVTFSVLASGIITGRVSSTGCTFSGGIAPRSRGSVFNISIRFDALTCGDALGSTAGIALFDASTAKLSGMALNAARSDGFVFSGLRN